MTIRELADEFLEHKKTRVKLSTLAAYAQTIKVHIVPYFGDEDISAGIDSKRANKFIEDILAAGTSVKYAQDINTTIGSIMNYGNLTHDIPYRPWKIAWPSRNMSKHEQIKYFSKEECKKVFDLMEEDPSPKLLGMVIGLTTGMRIGEICGLRFSDIDFAEHTLHVQRTVERVTITHSTINFDGQEIAKTSTERKSSNKSGIVINPPKTVDSNRIVPIAKLPYKWLKKYSAMIGDADAYVLTLTKKIYEPRSFRETYRRYLKRLGIQYLNPHCMRHTFATQMLHNKVDVATIAAILGHSSPAITLEIYSHTNEDEKKKQVNAVFGKLFK